MPPPSATDTERAPAPASPATSPERGPSRDDRTEHPTIQPWRGLIHHFRHRLPVSDATPVVTLCEGNTPLIEAPALAARLGVPGARVFLKFEGLNPTGSFKDRGMTMAISKAAEAGKRSVICASTGNTSAAAAAYARRAGMQCVVLIPEGNIALGKLSQALMHRATVLAVQGNFDEALDLVREIGRTHPVEIVNSLNPYRLQGQKTGAFEICEQLGEAPTHHCIPVGNAGNITAYWMGYNEYFAEGRIERRPRMLGFQAAGAAPIVRGEIVKNPETVATAIRIGNPVSWKQAIAARDESGGRIDAVTDEAILEAYRLVAGETGVLCEPASAASIAGMLQLAEAGYFREEARAGTGGGGGGAGASGGPPTVVCILTGHGLKDPNCAIKNSAPPIVVPARMEALLEHIRV